MMNLANDRATWRARLLVAGALSVLGACHAPAEEVVDCVAGTFIRCTCDNGAAGFAGCDAEGTGFSLPCECPPSPTGDVWSGPSSDTLPAHDLGPASDVEPSDVGLVPDASSPDVAVADVAVADVAVADVAGKDVTGSDVDDTSEVDLVDTDVVEPPPPMSWVALYDQNTTLEPALQEDTPTALITRFADRGRDRHAREDEFQAYDHYLSFYWEHRTVAVEIVDTIPKGGDTITFNVTSQWKLSDNQAELRFFYRGHNTVAEYYDNGAMTPLDTTHYTRSVQFNPKTGAPLAVGDRMEFELSQFLDAPPNGRENYYGTTYLYMVGDGLVPWEAHGVFGDFSTELEDSYPIPQSGWLGGGTTLSYAYSNEPDNHFMQMATNLSSINGQAFVEGRRVHHTDVGDGSHNESDKNPSFPALTGLLGSRYVNRSCAACHSRNGRALPPEVGQPLDQYVVKVGDAQGNPSPTFGAVFQPAGGSAEGAVTLGGWTEADGLRTPNYSFEGDEPDQISARIAPQLVGIGLLEAIEEAAIQALSDPDDADGDGISGRVRLVTDPQTGDVRMGRFGWKAGQPTVRHQVASALNTDMGVVSSVFPSPDCGSAQEGCSPGATIEDAHLESLTAYNALLGVRARRGLDDPAALAGENLFDQVGCTGCHTASFQTSAYHPHAELRSQTIAPYTDLLLHDMGPGLADTLAEGNAAGSEWRTPPLWGIGLTNGVSGGEAYLHDGRARTLREAIAWHGGEGEGARDAFNALTATEQTAILTFLSTL